MLYLCGFRDHMELPYGTQRSQVQILSHRLQEKDTVGYPFLYSICREKLCVGLCDPNAEWGCRGPTRSEEPRFWSGCSGMKTVGPMVSSEERILSEPWFDLNISVKSSAFLIHRGWKNYFETGNMKILYKEPYDGKRFGLATSDSKPFF